MPNRSDRPLWDGGGTANRPPRIVIPIVRNRLLQENGDRLLMENGDTILLESDTP